MLSHQENTHVFHSGLVQAKYSRNRVNESIVATHLICVLLACYLRWKCLSQLKKGDWNQLPWYQPLKNDWLHLSKLRNVILLNTLLCFFKRSSLSKHCIHLLIVTLFHLSFHCSIPPNGDRVPFINDMIKVLWNKKNPSPPKKRYNQMEIFL